MDPAYWQQRCSILLAPLGAVYKHLTGLRRKMWESGLLRRYRPACPCISVGNIAWGGTGKTPLTGWLMGWLLRHGVKPVVLSRGYKAEPSIVPLRISSHHTVRQTGDEPLMLARAYPEADVLVDPKRRRAAAYAERALQPGVLLLDDGFQHLAMARDIDLVLLRPVDVQSQWERVIPAGSWREGRSALSRADAFLIKALPEQMRELVPAVQEKLAAFRRPVFSFSLRPTGLRKVGETVGMTIEAFRGRPYVLVSGVGDPQQVYATAEACFGRAPEKHFIFADHYHYLFRDADRVAAWGLPVICTAKDAVKLRHIPIPDLWSLEVEAVFGPCLWSGEGFSDWWTARWEALAERYNIAWTRTATQPETVASDASESASAADSHPVSESSDSGDKAVVPDLDAREQETEKHDDQTCRAESGEPRNADADPQAEPPCPAEGEPGPGRP